MILSSSEFARPKVGILLLCSAILFLGGSSNKFRVMNFMVFNYILCVTNRVQRRRVSYMTSLQMDEMELMWTSKCLLVFKILIFDYMDLPVEILHLL